MLIDRCFVQDDISESGELVKTQIKHGYFYFTVNTEVTYFLLLRQLNNLNNE